MACLSVTIGVPNVEETAAYYADFGLAPQDDGWFSTLDHNVLVLAAPVSFLHHTSWQVDDVDDVGRGALRHARGPPLTARLGPGPALRRARTSSGT